MFGRKTGNIKASNIKAGRNVIIENRAPEGNIQAKDITADENVFIVQDTVDYIEPRKAEVRPISLHKAPPSAHKQNAPTSVNNMLSFAERVELVEHLLAIASITDGGTRTTVIDQLPTEIKMNIRNSSVDKTHVFNIVDTCLQHPNGMQKLRDILEFFEGESIAMQQFKEALNHLSPSG